MPIDLSTDFLFFLAILLIFVGGVYVFIHRTLSNFREGIEKGRR